VIAYIIRRLLLAILTTWAITVLSFVIIQLPPGDYVTSYIASMSSSGILVTEADAQALRVQYGLDQPIYVQYLKWMGMIAQGRFGMAIEWGRPVMDVIGDRLTLTIVISLAAIIFTWALALPIGIYSAVKRYSIGDYIATLIGFIGLAIPGFMLALIVMYRWRVVLRGDVRRALGLGEVRGPAQASPDRRDRVGHRGHRTDDPHHAF
jgi:peptide/nickel transport system permease protein